MKPKKTCPNDYEHEAWAAGKLVLGIDEAGRGPLAGPLVCAGVVFPAGYENPEIYDSKAISEKKRDILFDVIKEDALYYEIRIVTPEEISNCPRCVQSASASSVTLSSMMLRPHVNSADDEPSTLPRSVSPIVSYM